MSAGTHAGPVEPAGGERAATAGRLRRVTAARFAATTGGFAALAALASLVGLAVGPSELALGDVVRIVFGALGLGDAAAGDAAGGAAADIVLRIRLPRVLLALLVGAALATSGVVFQALLRNPLADPFVLGISGGAALAGIAMLALGGALGFGAAAVPPAAFAGSVLATVALYAIAGAGGRISPTNLLLTGVVFNAFASAAIVFLASLAGLTEGARIFLWLIGNLGAAGVRLCGHRCALPVRGRGGRGFARAQPEPAGAGRRDGVATRCRDRGRTSAGCCSPRR